MNDDDLIRRGDAKTLLQMFVPASIYEKALSSLGKVPRRNRDLTEGEEISIHLAMGRIPAITPSLDAAAMRMRAKALEIIEDWEDQASERDNRDPMKGVIYEEALVLHHALALPLRFRADRLAEALRLPEVSALVEAATAARIVLAEHEPHPLPVLGKLLTALRALTGEARHD